MCIRDSGILDDLTREVSLSDGGVAPNQKSLFVCFYDHPTHWILAGRFHENDDDKENGFVVTAWPRNKWPRSTPAEILAQIELVDATYRVEKFGDVKPPLS